jgi:hypothetical protein
VALVSNTLLITATIAPPPGVPKLKRTDPAQRMRDYAEALDFYCRLPADMIHRIVFIENSAADVSPLRDVAEKAGAASRMEFVSFNGLDHPPAYGRGYGEFKLLDHAIQNSPSLSKAADDERLWKTTGRYRVLNLVKLIRTAPAEFDLYCDLRDRPIPWMDLRVFAATVAGYRKLLMGLYTQLREDVLHMSPEQHLRPIIGELAKSNRIVTRFRREPSVDGIRGMDSKNYSTGVNLLKYWYRSTTRHIQNLVGVP